MGHCLVTWDRPSQLSPAISFEQHSCFCDVEVVVCLAVDWPGRLTVGGVGAPWFLSVGDEFCCYLAVAMATSPCLSASPLGPT